MVLIFKYIEEVIIYDAIIFDGFPRFERLPTTNLELPKLFSAKCTFFEQHVNFEKNGFGDKKVNSLIK